MGLLQQVNPFTAPEPHKQAILQRHRQSLLLQEGGMRSIPLLLIQPFAIGLTRARPGEALTPGSAGGAQPESPPTGSAPIDAVVAGRMSRPGKIGDFIAAVASPGEARTGGCDPIGSPILIRKFQLTTLLKLREHRARFHTQVIDGKMRRCHRNGTLQLNRPGVVGLIGQIANQIKAPAAQSALLNSSMKPLTGLQQVGAAMTAAQ